MEPRPSLHSPRRTRTLCPRYKTMHSTIPNKVTNPPSTSHLHGLLPRSKSLSLLSTATPVPIANTYKVQRQNVLTSKAIPPHSNSVNV
jgi:hypothetical protein